MRLLKYISIFVLLLSIIPHNAVNSQWLELECWFICSDNDTCAEFEIDIDSIIQGFIGEYEIVDPDDIIEVVVRFITPSVTVMNLINDGRRPNTIGHRFYVYIDENGDVIYRKSRQIIWNTRIDISFEEQAMGAHTAFREQLSEIMRDDEYEIFTEIHRTFNGVYIRVRGGMVKAIATLPEVFTIIPHKIPIIHLPPQHGQVLNRGTITVADASLAFRGVLGLADLTPEQRYAASFGEGEPHIGHVLRIFRYALGLSGEL
jgi:hypothetical protein